MTILPQAIHRFNTIPIKLTISFVNDLEKKKFNLYGNTKDPKQPKQSSERKIELEESGSLTSHYTTKLQSSKPYGTGTKTECVHACVTGSPCCTVEKNRIGKITIKK